MSTDSRPFSLTLEGGQTLRGSIDRLAADPVARVVLIPAFGLSMLDLLTPAYYLLVNGFEVVRFDPTCHVGTSDGEIGDFTLGGMADDIAAVLEAYADEATAVVSISLSSRAAFRALGSAQVRGTVFLSPVVHTQRTLLEVCGDDLIGDYLSDRSPDDYTILGLTVKKSFCADCVDGGFADLQGALDDASRLRMPCSFIAGSTDRWVDIAEVEQIAAAIPQARVKPLTGANHQMFRSPVILKSYLGAALAELFALYGLAGEPSVPAFRDVIQFVNQSKDRHAA